MQVCSPLELEKQCQGSCQVDLGIGGFLSSCHNAITPAIVYLEGIGISESFEIVARPLEFLSSVKLRPPPCEVLREHRDSFPNKAGKWTLI